MSLPAKKVAQDLATKVVIPAASRAVSAVEGPTIVPNSTSTTTETSMPWEGWVSSFLSTKLGSDRFEKLRSYLVWKPDDRYDLHQIPKPNVKVPLTEDGKFTATFRTPSPGSHTAADGSSALQSRQPNEDEGTLYDDPYFVSYYPRDTTRRNEDPAFPNKELEQMKLDLLPQDSDAVKEAQEKMELGAKSSPGNKGTFATGKSTFDTTGGLRAAMSTNHEAVEKSLDSYMPNHLPVAMWWDKQDEIVQWCDDNDLPTPIGGTGFGTVPREGRIARW